MEPSHGVVVDSVNVSVLEYVPVRNASFALMCCLNVIVTGSLDTGALHVAFESSTTSGSGNENVPFVSLPVSEAIGRDAGVADVSGYTDYGRVWSEYLALVEDDLHPRATVIVLGDARTNGRDPRADLFALVAERAGRTFWLNPEPQLYWNYGDSVVRAYAPFCELYECWTTRQLEDFVKALTRPQHA